jgi:methylmalonyl-CoA mutase
MQENNVSKLNVNQDLNLDFPVPTFEEWKDQVVKDLKGVPYEKKLITKTYEGIDLNPIYVKQDLEGIEHLENTPGFISFVRGGTASGYVSNGWNIAQSYSYADAEEFNSAIINDLKRGQNAVYMKFDSATDLGLDSDYATPDKVGDKGLSISAIQSFKRALMDYNFAQNPLFIETGFSSLSILFLLNGLLEENKIDKKLLKGSLEADPISYLAVNGELPVSFNSIIDEQKTVTEWCVDNLPNVKTLAVNGKDYHNAGANAVQELAFAISSAVEIINNLLAKGLTINQIANQFKFNFGVGTFYFMEVAKLRAHKIIWTKVLNEFGYTDEIEHNLHAETSKYFETVFDPYVNMLRTTTEAFSAVIGGVNSLTTNPFDNSIGLPNDFSRRIARNTQLILDEESNLSRIIDPAGGSFYVEKLTDQVAKEAWKLFQEIENNGGMLKSLQNGFVQNKIQKVVDERKKNLAKRKDVLVGTNMYVNPKEEILNGNKINKEEFFKKRSEYLQKYRTSGNNEKHSSIINKLNDLLKENSKEIVEVGTMAVLEGATLGEITKVLRSSAGEKIVVEKIPQLRLSQIFEDLRNKSISISKSSGEKPKVFLMNMGSVKQHKGRADFSRGFFEVAAFDVIYPNGFENAEAAVEALKESNSKVAVICSTDDIYPDLVPQIMEKIKSENLNVKVVLAGYPKEQIEEHKKNGIHDFIYLGCDVLQVLDKMLNEYKN